MIYEIKHAPSLFLVDLVVEHQPCSMPARRLILPTQLLVTLSVREPNDPDPLWKVDMGVTSLENICKICHEISEQKNIDATRRFIKISKRERYQTRKPIEFRNSRRY